jgi:hypothetical protein
MVPRTYPSTFAPSGQQQMVVYFLTSVVGLQRWSDYIPVKLSNGGVENSNNNNGYINVAIVLQGVTTTSDPLDCGVSSAPTPDKSPLRIIGWSLAQSYIT